MKTRTTPPFIRRSKPKLDRLKEAGLGITSLQTPTPPTQRCGKNLEDLRPVPWSETHKVFAEHLSQVQWGPSKVTPQQLQQLKDRPNINDHSSAAIEPFTMSELTTAIRKIKKGRAPGLDGLRSELILALDHWGEQQLLRAFNECLFTAKVPAEWKEALVVSLYKGKGSDSSPENYRPISLLNTTYKLYAAMIQARLAEAHDAQLRATQYGFRQNRGTKQPLFILRRLQDYSAKTGIPFHVLFLDWKQAFDKVDHSSMLTALQRLGVHPHYVEVVKDLYTDMSVFVRKDGTIH